MRNPEQAPPSGLNRQELEDERHGRLELARRRYDMASKHYRDLLRRAPEGLIPNPDTPLALARHAESEALAEYTRILKLFTELTVNRRSPEEQIAESHGGKG